MRSFVHHLPKNTSQDEVLKLIEQMNKDKKVHGILIQLPLPKQIDAATVLKAVDPDKDVDGLHIENAGRLASGLTGLFPCTPLGCLALIKTVEKNLVGLHAVVVGRSTRVGKPMAQWLMREKCTVTVIQSRTPQPSHVARTSDILIVAAGQPGLVTGEWIKPGAIVIDVGITREDDRIVGDVDFASASKVAGHITPVPGGVGPMTIACLLGNTVAAACRQNELTVPHI